MAIYRFRKEELENQLNKNALWAIVYGDLMSYLMILFLLMLSFTLAKESNTSKLSQVEQSLVEIQRVFGGKIDPKLAARAKRRDKELLLTQNLKARALDGELGKATKIVVTEKRISLELGGGILFDSGRARLKRGASRILRTIAQDMKSLENFIRVEGHTNNVRLGRHAKYDSNWELSMARAYAVIRELEKAGVDQRRLSGVGYGEFHPIGDNKTAAGRAKNRRIEISLLRED
ncbi:MAG: OmpA family protein [Elusimicrobiota bacterium]